MEQNFQVFATGVDLHPLPNDPCFRVNVRAKNRRDAVAKAIKMRPDLKAAHPNCTWAAYVVGP
ncbi:MAG: hypothetical protein AAF197_08715 [Pseudomonadota bacterium]